jgi:excisionase family DNA binding protein
VHNATIGYIPRQSKAGAHLKPCINVHKPSVFKGTSVVSSREEVEMIRVYTVREVAEILKVNPRTIERLVASHKLDAIHVGRRLRVTHESLEAYCRQATGVQDDMSGTTP